MLHIHTFSFLLAIPFSGFKLLVLFFRHRTRWLELQQESKLISVHVRP